MVIFWKIISMDGFLLLYRRKKNGYLIERSRMRPGQADGLLARRMRAQIASSRGCAALLSIASAALPRHERHSLPIFIARPLSRARRMAVAMHVRAFCRRSASARVWLSGPNDRRASGARSRSNAQTPTFAAVRRQGARVGAPRREPLARLLQRHARALSRPRGLRVLVEPIGL